MAQAGVETDCFEYEPSNRPRMLMEPTVWAHWPMNWRRFRVFCLSLTFSGLLDLYLHGDGFEIRPRTLKSVPICPRFH